MREVRDSERDTVGLAGKKEDQAREWIEIRSWLTGGEWAFAGHLEQTVIHPNRKDFAIEQAPCCVVDVVRFLARLGRL